METQTKYRDVKTAVTTLFQSTSLPEQAIFRKEGEYGAIGYGEPMKRTTGIMLLGVAIALILVVNTLQAGSVLKPTTIAPSPPAAAAMLEHSIMDR